MNRHRHPSLQLLTIIVGAMLSLGPAIAQRRLLTANDPSAPSAAVAPAPPANAGAAGVPLSPVAATMPAAAPPGTGEIGSTTRSLFRLQAEPRRPGSLPTMPGQAATAAYQRYLKSFEHPLPEFYENKLGAGSVTGGGMSGGN